MSIKESFYPRTDTVPEGTFASDEYDPARIAAVRKIIEISNRVSSTNPEISDMYKNTDLTYAEIAEQVIPEEVAISAGVAENAVGLAIRSLLPEEELAEAIARRKVAAVEKQRQNMGDEVYRAHQRAASQRRHELHGVDVNAMIQGRGRTPWTTAEKNLVVSLSSDPQFQHQHGGPQMRGFPNFTAIAYAVNELQHNGTEVRSKSSVSSLIKDIKRGKNKI